jgi:integral membrane sensor domain MASE1
MALLGTGDSALSLCVLTLLVHSARLFFTAPAQGAKHYGALYAADASQACTAGALLWFGHAIAARAAMLLTGWYTATSDEARAMILKGAGLCSLASAAKMIAQQHNLLPDHLKPMVPDNVAAGMALGSALFALYHAGSASLPAMKFDMKDWHHVLCAAITFFSLGHAYLSLYKPAEGAARFFENAGAGRTCSDVSHDAMRWFGLGVLQNALVMLVVFFANSSHWQRAALFLTMCGVMTSALVLYNLRVRDGKQNPDMQGTGVNLALAYGCFVFGWSIKPKTA